MALRGPDLQSRVLAERALLRGLGAKLRREANERRFSRVVERLKRAVKPLVPPGPPDGLPDGGTAD